MTRYFIGPLTTFVGVSGFVLGGNWVWLGASTYLVLMALDLALPKDFENRRLNAPGIVRDIPLYLHSIGMFALYGGFLLWVATGFSLQSEYAMSQLVGAALSLGWLSGVPTLPVAHELMHRRGWLPRVVSRLISVFYMDTTRDVGHLIGHHIHLNTPKDADTPVRGQTIYSFMWQATAGSWRDAVHASTESLRRRGKSVFHPEHAAYQIILAPLVLLGIAFAVGGIVALSVTLVALMMGKAFVEAFNYFQHYGLVRPEGAKVEIQHAWNHMGRIVRPLGVEITNHINHHRDSYIRYDELPVEPEAPQMPSLFLCFLTALIPPLWTRLIAQPKLREWDKRYANAAERELAKQANRKAGWPDWFDDQEDERHLGVAV